MLDKVPAKTHEEYLKKNGIDYKKK
jgi:hypothetical protein